MAIKDNDNDELHGIHVILHDYPKPTMFQM